MSPQISECQHKQYSAFSNQKNMLDGFTVSSNCWFWSQLKLGSETDQMPNSTKVEMISFAKEMAGDPKRVCESLQGVIRSRDYAK